MPKATTIALLVNPNNAEAEAERSDVQAAAQALGQQLLIVDVSSEHDIDTPSRHSSNAGGCAARRCRPVFVLQSGTDCRAGRALWRSGDLSAARVRRGRRPDELWSQHTDAYRQAGIYAGRILKGEKPADLPVMQSTKFEFVINLKTAKALGLDVPPTLLALADEVIE